MSIQDRVRWDDIYKQQESHAYPAPDPLLLVNTPLVDSAHPTPPRALDLCAGVGQNGIWLAEQGYTTDIMDISRIALQRARQVMTERNIRNVNLFQIDVDYLQLESETYDVVCVFRYLRRNLFPILKRGTKHGGRILYETYNMRYLSLVPAFNREFLLEVGEIQRYFSDWRTLYYEENDHCVRLVAERP